MDPRTLAEQLERELGARLCFAFHDLQSGQRLSYRADEPVATASVIKLPILVHVALEVEGGRLDWGERIALGAAVRAPGTGILKQLGDGLVPSVRDLAVLMTALSDNTATNMLIDRVGIAAVNDRLAALGMAETRLLRRVFAPDTPATRPFGLGVTTAHEAAGLLARVARGELDGAAATVVAELLAMQQDRAAIPRMLPAGWQYAGKTGSNPDLRADVGILSGPGGRQVVLAAFCAALPRVDWGVDNPGLLAIARLALALVAP